MRKFEMAATLLHERYIYYLSFTLRWAVCTLNTRNVHPAPPDASLTDFLFIWVPCMGIQFAEKNID